MTENQQLIHAYQAVRNKTVELCSPLATEDYVIQSMDDVSPPKWHLAHTTWFFETFILMPFLAGYQQFDASFQHLFNSYYQTLGHPYPRIKRGLLSRPTVATIYKYRDFVDQHVMEYIDEKHEEDELQKLKQLLTLGLHHEQQHQELLLMDIKHNLFLNPHFPAYQQQMPRDDISPMQPLQLTQVTGGVIEIGHQGKNFSFDNELPRHQLFIRPYLIANRLVTNSEYCEFMAAGGYQKPDWWLADGWECVQKNNWQAPLYWHHQDNEWYVFTLNGLQPLVAAEPVAHISFFEADAYARWRGARLPLEAEWEHYVTSTQTLTDHENLLEKNLFHPCPLPISQASHFQQFYGDVWEWTASPYCPYPGYKPLSGALGEYNGKFMSNQMVLRGGSCATPKTHIRASYRNFFQPDKRWQFSGIRIATDI